ncbi:MAG: glycosyltransferase family 4 protein, partial [Bacteroidales bacterium]|nr:glycosyltransferase family 4 protein [Bacteroidales bacterium]
KRALVREKVDLFFSPEGFVCLSSKIPTVNIIHDINFEHFPEFLQKSHRRYYQKYFPQYAQHSDALITVSEFCKRDIAETYHLPEDKIRVAGNAAAEDFFPLSESEKREVREKWTGGKPYFVFVGTINKRKNIISQLKAYNVFRERGNEAAFVFVGSKKHWDAEMEHCLNSLPYSSDIMFTNYISTTDLNRILASACALMYVSSFEGFGVPILEAFAAETPVITASVTAMPEVAGDAALLVHPDDVPGISAAMQRVFTDMELRGRLVEKGRLRQRSFSWDSTADILWRIIEKQYYSSNLNHDEKQ